MHDLRTPLSLTCAGVQRARPLGWALSLAAVGVVLFARRRWVALLRSPRRSAGVAELDAAEDSCRPSAPAGLSSIRSARPSSPVMPLTPARPVSRSSSCSRRLIRVGAGGGARGAGNLGMAGAAHLASTGFGCRRRIVLGIGSRSPSRRISTARRDPRTTAAGFGPLAQSVTGRHGRSPSSIATLRSRARDAHRAPPSFPSRSLPRVAWYVRVAP